MKRKDFINKGLKSLGGFCILPVIAEGCGKVSATGASREKDCQLSPSETSGPFPTKSPAELVKSNIIIDRLGIPLQIELTVLHKKNGCAPLSQVLVDVWHCDSHGVYSEYGGMRMQRTDARQAHFLRGRLETDVNGHVSFVSIFPGWYPGRAPHIHVEVLDKNEKSLLVTQIAFPEEVSSSVYKTDAYAGAADTSNTRDNIFRNSLEGNMGRIDGNLTDGFVLTYDVVVAG